MMPDSMCWKLIRRRNFIKTLDGFKAHILTYATPDCIFDEYVSLQRESIIFSCRLGRATYISGAVLSNVTLGKFCSIGQGARVGLGRHPTNFLSTHPAFYSSKSQTNLQFAIKSDFDEILPVKIGNDVWVGANSLVMGGITIGDGAIIGAGSIVTKDVPSYAIVVGSPAKIIKYRFDEKTIEILLSLKWWNKTNEEIKHLLNIISPSGPVSNLDLEYLIKKNDYDYFNQK